MVRCPETVWLPLDGVVKADFAFASFTEAEDAELIGLTVTDADVKANGLWSSSDFFVVIEEGLLVEQLLLTFEIQGKGARVE